MRHRRTISLLSFAAITLLVVSCNEKEGERVWNDPNFIRLTSTPEKVISGERNIEIKWKEAVSLKVFDNSGKSVELRNMWVQDTIFTSKGWTPDALPKFAAYPSTEDVLCMPDGTFTIAVPSQQKATTANYIENFTAVAKVQGVHCTAYSASPLRLVNGYVAVKIAFPLVTSITVEAVGNENVSGMVEVDCNNMEITAEAGNSTPITLASAVDGETLKVGTHYIAVVPQTYSQGLKVTIYYKNGTPVSKTFFESGVNVSRSSVVELGEGAIDADIPDEISIKLDFGRNVWPFVEPVLSEDKQVKSETGTYTGDTYTYEYAYELNSKEVTRCLEFFIRGNNNPYKLDKTFNPGSKNSRITLPALPGRYLKAVKLETTNSATYPKGFKLQDMDWKDLAQSPVKSSKDNPAVLSFPTNDGVVTESGTAYHMYFTEGSASIVSISLLYSEQLPPSYDDDPFNEKSDDEGSENPDPLEDNLPETVELNVDFTKGWPFIPGIKAAADQNTAEDDVYMFSYRYMYEGSEISKDFTFGFKGGIRSNEYNAYSFKTDEFYPGVANCRMMIPAVESRYLLSVTMEVKNKTPNAKTFSLKTMTNGNFVACPGSAILGTPATLNFPITVDGKTINTTKGTGYYMYFSNANTTVTAIRLVYVSEEPSIE